MLDSMRILTALAAAAGTAAAVLLLCGWPWRTPRPARVSLGGVVGTAAGFYVGSWLLGLRPHWPPREDADRLQLVLLPALIAVELLAALPGRHRWAAWPARGAIAACAVRILLHDTIFIADLGVPGTPQWTPGQIALVLGGSAAALTVVWGLLILLARRSPGYSLPLALSLTCAGAAATIMLSGYIGGGLLGLALAAALAGTTLAALLFSTPLPANGFLGLGIVGLFAVLVMGHFFGNLTTTNAVLLFCAPLLCWLPELPPRFRSVVRIAWPMIPVAVALTLAQQKFAQDSDRTSDPAQPSTSQPDAGTRDAGRARITENSRSKPASGSDADERRTGRHHGVQRQVRADC